MREPPPYPPPVFRELRGYAFDPSLSTRLETALVNEVTFRVPWEQGLAPGPVGEYLEVVDHDPASGCFYAPVDLDDPALLAQDGLAPSEGDPRFHQQMVYAVAMTTIAHFERALGRRALWSPRYVPTAPPGKRFQYVPRLRIYPHALRQANAFYSPEKKALLFGYFPAAEGDGGAHFPGGMVFTCLSHDIIAHETTHALLDGMHRRFVEATHPDGLAFHEAFADIVALFQHFTYPEVLRSQIAATRGDLASQSLLGQLAQQFGQATGSYGALRDAIGRVNPQTRRWEPREPDPADYATVLAPHDRGAILVAAVFDAFLSIYRSRVADLLRIATGGTGVPQPGALHPDLVARLASEASRAAKHVLTMCIRALDYCPPVDITFGDYLRALVTADYEMVRDDDRGYRLAFIEAFRRRGIHPRDVRTLSEASLRWSAGVEDAECDLGPLCGVLREFVEELSYPPAPGAGTPADPRERFWRRMNQFGAKLNLAIRGEGFDREAFGRLTGLRLAPGPRGTDGEVPKLEVHSIRPARRVGPDGDLLNEVVVSITQRMAVPDEEGGTLPPGWGEGGDGDGAGGFWFRGGCTLILDLETQSLRYAVSKRIGSEGRLRRQREFRRTGRMPGLRATYFGGPRDDREPFALLHSSHEAEP